MSLVRGALSRPVTVTMLCLAAMVLGLVGLGVIPLQLLPGGFEARGLTLIFPYPNSDPLSVERDVARPVEEALATVPWISRVEAHCLSNRVRMNVSFAGGTDMGLAVLEVRDRLERLRPELPREARSYFMWRHSADRFPDMAWGALVPRSAGLEAFRVLEQRLLPRLSRVDGVAGVDVWGGLVDREVHVELEPDRVAAHRVRLFDLVARLSAENFNLPAGTVQDGGRRLFVRSTATFAGLSDVAAFPVTDELTLGDLGEVALMAGYRDSVSRMDGRPIVWMVVRRESGRNTVEVCRQVREAVGTLGDDPALAGFELLPMWDAGESIEAALGQLEQSLLLGGLLAIGVLAFFFRDWRATLIIAAAIPFSFLVALSLLAGFGFTLNVLTLAGLTLVVGMLVDNAIVVVENVVRRRERGEASHDAAANGSGEVALAISLATLTSIVVFLPLLFIEDEPVVRVMFTNLAMPISLGLLASLVTALLVVPLLASRLHTGAVPPSSGVGGMARLREASLATLQWAMVRRVEALLLTLLLVGGGGWLLGKAVDKVGDGGGPRERLRIGVSLDASTTPTEADAVFNEYEQFLLPRKREFGIQHVQVRFNPKGGSIQLRLLPPGERDDIEGIRKKLRIELPRLPGAELEFGGGDEDEGEERSGGELTVALSGPDTEQLHVLAAEVVKKLEATGVFEEVRGVDEDTGREVQVRLDRDALERTGVTPRQVLGTLSYQLRGSRLPDLRVGDDDLPLIIGFDNSNEPEGLAWLRGTSLGVEGGSVPLESVATLVTGRGPSTIRRVDRRTQVEIKATSNRDAISQAHQKTQEVMASLALPADVTYEVGGAFRDFNSQVGEVFKVLGLGVVFMFLLMGILFESFLLPLAVLPALPFAFVGAYLGLWVTGTPQDVVATLGAVILAGIVVNNAIVLVDAINRGLGEGLSQAEAVTRGVSQRFRPVLLTASTTVVGLLPMAWSPATEGVMSYHSLARAVIGGMIVSTLGTLVVVPLCWVALDDLRRRLSRLVAATLPEADLS